MPLLALCLFMLTSTPPCPESEPASPLVQRRTLPVRTIARIFRDMPGFLSEVTQKHGDAVLLQIGRKRIYIFNHPDLIEEVLVGQGRNFVKPPTMPQLRSIFGQGLLTSEGELHRRQRRSGRYLGISSNPIFRRGTMLRRPSRFRWSFWRMAAGTFG